MNKSYLKRGRFSIALLFTLLGTATITPTWAQQTTEVQSNPPPNVVFNVVTQAGNCPQTVSLWNISLGYRNTEVYFSETTVIADTLEIAGPAQLRSSGQRLAEYSATLKPDYTSCIGKATSEENPNYSFQFQNGNVYFLVNLTNIPEGFGGGITYKKVIGLRPYVIWIFVD